MQSTQQAPTRVTPAKNRGGEWVTFGDEQYRVPPLSLRSVIDLQAQVETLKAMAGGRPTADQMDVIVDIVHAALARNYPDLPRDDVGDMVDLSNYREVLGAVLQIAGFVRREGEASGEAAVASTGTASTPS